jgi:predicted N-formylglutamate amidohydrolase
MLRSPITEPGQAPGAVPPVELIDGDAGSGLVILCDHASNYIPDAYDGLGLGESVRASHVAYDIGARAVAAGLAVLTGAPAVMTCHSRLLIDPNRATDDPTLVMRIADGSVITGNARIDGDEIARRAAAFHAPYHAAIDGAIGRAIEAGRPPAILSVHSFTPRFHGVERPWHATVLWDRDPRLPLLLLDALGRERDLVIGENVPYSGKLKGDTLYRHATGRGLAHALIEIRQDLIADADGQGEWAERLARIMPEIVKPPDLHEIRFFGSDAGG